jgi:hypothetical protein
MTLKDHTQSFGLLRRHVHVLSLENRELSLCRRGIVTAALGAGPSCAGLDMSLGIRLWYRIDGEYGLSSRVVGYCLIPCGLVPRHEGHVRWP